MNSIVSAYYRNEEMTREFLDNLKVDAEVILVNAGSKPISHLSVSKLITLKENKSFSNSMNAGIHQAKGDYICVIGNDVFPEGDWLERLVKRARETGAYITSPINDKTNLPMYKLEPKDDYYLCKEMFPAVCWVLSRECLDKVGYFDEDFLIGTYEDNLYCYKVLKAGGKIVVDPTVSVRHLVSQTMNLFDISKAMSDNRKLFEEKKRAIDRE